MKNKPHLHLKKSTPDGNEFYLSILLQVPQGTTVTDPYEPEDGTFRIDLSNIQETETLELKAWEIAYTGHLTQDAIEVKVLKIDTPLPNTSLLGKAKVRYEDAEDPEILIPTN